MATTPIASLVACSWCGLMAERGVICDACGSPVTDSTSRTTVLHVPEASPHHFRGAVRPSYDVVTSPPPRPAAPTPVHPAPEQPEGPRAVTRPAGAPQQAAARWVSLQEASAMAGVSEGTLRAWALSRTPEDAPVREGEPRFLLIRTAGLRLPEGLWMVDGTAAYPVPIAAATPVAPAAPTVPPAPVAPVTRPDPVPSVARPEVAAPAMPPAPAVQPVERGSVLPPRPRPEPRTGALSDSYVEALLAEDPLPDTWTFDPTSEERKTFRRHRILTIVGIVLGFAGAAELIDFLTSHIR